MKKDYAPYFCSYGPQCSGGRTPLERNLLDTEAALASFRERLKAKAATAPAELDATLAAVEKRLGEYRAVPTLAFEGHDALTSTSSDVNLMLTRNAAYYLKVMEGALGAGAPAVEAGRRRIEAATKRVGEVAREIDEVLADNYPAPVQKYAGKDLPALVKAATEYLSDKGEVVKVVAVGDSWSHASGSEWRGDVLVDFDHSFLKLNVVTRIDERTGTVWSLTARKDHIDGDKIKFDVYLPMELGKMRLAKLNR